MKKITLLAVAGFVLLIAVNAFAVPRLETYIVGSASYEKALDDQDSDLWTTRGNGNDIDLSIPGNWQATIGEDNGNLPPLVSRGHGHSANGRHGRHDRRGRGDDRGDRRRHATPEPGTLSLLGLGLLGLAPILKRKKA